FFFFSSRRRHTRCLSDWSSDVCSSDLGGSFSESPTNPRPCHSPDLSRDEIVSKDLVSGKAADPWVIPKMNPLALAALPDGRLLRSEERRVGNGCSGEAVRGVSSKRRRG